MGPLNTLPHFERTVWISTIHPEEILTYSNSHTGSLQAFKFWSQSQKTKNQVDIKTHHYGRTVAFLI